MYINMHIILNQNLENEKSRNRHEDKLCFWLCRLSAVFMVAVLVELAVLLKCSCRWCFSTWHEQMLLQSAPVLEAVPLVVSARCATEKTKWFTTLLPFHTAVHETDLLCWMDVGGYQCSCVIIQTQRRVAGCSALQDIDNFLSGNLEHWVTVKKSLYTV